MRDLLSAWPSGWLFWALLAAGFAALTAILAKIGVAEVDPDFATFVRTVVILCFTAGILWASGHWQSPAGVPGRSWLFLVLSGAATGASWLCYFRALKLGDAARVAPVDKLSIVFVAVFAAIFLGERLSAVNWLGVAMVAGGAVLLAFRP
ncbi:EamA family transporter [Zavarzinia compransoris]|uniref:EamA family transporter n=1 Tax=Zavarzinia marina TaxID=2911065 RepID=UPI001F16F636|nr:EamA family transporter [Zavarzinia marina]MCF4167145.1 EamA family transporter [Zavarzinia marina]